MSKRRSVPKGPVGSISDTARVDSLQLSTKAVNVLLNAGIATVDDLCATAEWELLRERQCGRVTIAEIKTMLKSYGRRLTPKCDRDKLFWAELLERRAAQLRKEAFRNSSAERIRIEGKLLREAARKEA